MFITIIQIILLGVAGLGLAFYCLVISELFPKQEDPDDEDPDEDPDDFPGVF